MSKINKKSVLKATYSLKEKSNNKIWGLISLFAVTDNRTPIEGNVTYTLNSDKLSLLLQDLFYFGIKIKEFNTDNQFYFRLSDKWNSSILEYVSTEKPSILDAAIFYFKSKEFSSTISSNDLVSDFINQLNIPKSTLGKIFSLTFEDEDIVLEKTYPKKEILDEFKRKFSLSASNDTLSFDSPYTIASHPSELKRAPFIQTLYSGSKIQELILLTDFDLDDFYPKSSKLNSIKSSNGINKIFYGAPGTGKSHRVNELISHKLERTERITFHPEYDYSSFVGGYKPTMDGENIRYEFVPQAFTNIYVKAWNNLDHDYYLVIEEINRGNCAEIFGDIFQLLDRTNDYKITPSKELKEYLATQLVDNKDINAEKLLLPPNLNILATMNTSDQSLFPMDSAFKRRWNWEYIPINYDFTETNSSSKFKVQISDNESFSWLSFIKAVNALIKSNDNLGMDKCLGNYFIKPESENIDIETFINKAIFYLWNDVFKDEVEEDNLFKDRTTYEDFFPIESNGIEKVKEILSLLKVEIIDTTTAQ